MTDEYRQGRVDGLRALASAMRKVLAPESLSSLDEVLRAAVAESYASPAAPLRCALSDPSPALTADERREQETFPHTTEGDLRFYAASVESRPNKTPWDQGLINLLRSAAREIAALSTPPVSPPLKERICPGCGDDFTWLKPADGELLAEHNGHLWHAACVPGLVPPEAQKEPRE